MENAEEFGEADVYLVGRPDAAVKEYKGRVSSALAYGGFRMPADAHSDPPRSRPPAPARAVLRFDDCVRPVGGDERAPPRDTGGVFDRRGNELVGVLSAWTRQVGFNRAGAWELR